jgi:hypothetical protein
LTQVLTSKLSAPVYVLPDSQGTHLQSRSLSQTAFWVGAMVILFGFFWIQVGITRLIEGWGQTALLALSVVPVFALIRFWNSLFI